MLQLNLSVNGVILRLGEALDEELLVHAGFRELVPHERLTRDIPYKARAFGLCDCRISFWDGRYVLLPVLDPLAGPFQLSSAATVLGSKYGLYSVTCQALENVMIANNEYSEFCEVCEENIAARAVYESAPEFDESKLAIWRDENSRVIAEFNARGKSFSVHWRLDGA